MSYVVSEEEFVSNFDEYNQAFLKLAYTVKNLPSRHLHVQS